MVRPYRKRLQGRNGRSVSLSAKFRSYVGAAAQHLSCCCARYWRRSSMCRNRRASATATCCNVLMYVRCTLNCTIMRVSYSCYTVHGAVCCTVNSGYARAVFFYLYFSADRCTMDMSNFFQTFKNVDHVVYFHRHMKCRETF